MHLIQWQEKRDQLDSRDAVYKDAVGSDITKWQEIYGDQLDSHDAGYSTLLERYDMMYGVGTEVREETRMMGRFTRGAWLCIV
jgi:hypothetical protein